MAEFKLKQTAEEVQKAIDDASVHSDWNQTDSSAADFIKNKPFGSAEQVILPQGEVQFLFDEEMGGCGAILEITATINDKDEVVVSWDGVVYRSEALFSNAVYFGNLAMMGMPDTGEPFIGMYTDGTLTILDLTSTENVTREISIAVASRTTVPLEYLPYSCTTFYFQHIGGGYVYSDPACTAPLTFEDAVSAVMKGFVSLRFAGMPIRYIPSISANREAHFEFLVVTADEPRIFYTAEYVPES